MTLFTLPYAVGRGSRPLVWESERSYASSTIVTGPSLTSSTSIRAPKTPCATTTPRSRNASQKRSYDAFLQKPYEVDQALRTLDAVTRTAALSLD